MLKQLFYFRAFWFLALLYSVMGGYLAKFELFTMQMFKFHAKTQR